MRTTTERTNYGEYDIEIVEVNELENEVEVFARAWKGDTQLGFGNDGSVDIERFRIFNPPVLVPDENGTIIKTDVDDETDEVFEYRYSEDPQKALIDTLLHNLSVMKNLSTEGNIQAGKRGNTTSTFYPSAGTNVPVDGRVGSGATLITDWASKVSHVGDNSSSTDVANSAGRMRSHSTTGNWDIMYRGIFGFDTSSIPDGDPISSASFSLFGFASTLDDFSSSLVVDRTVPASTSALADSDFDVTQWDGVEQATARITGAAWSVAGYNDFTLNGTGIGNIDKTGLTWFGTRLDADFDNLEPTWVSSNNTNIRCHFADQTGTTNDPKLVVEHGVAAASGFVQAVVLA